MSTLEDLRIEAGLTMTQLAREAKISRVSLEKAEQGEPIRGDVAGKICSILSDRLNRRITYKDAGISIL
jgi:predicted transcriptional regulator